MQEWTGKRKRGMLAGMLLCFLMVFLASADAQKNKPKPLPGREILALNGRWNFHTDPQDIGRKAGWEKALPTDAAERETVVPSVWEQRDAPGYQGIAWYEREFTIPLEWSKRHVRLQFLGVSAQADYWLNGKPLGSSTLAASPVVFDITKPVSDRQTHRLVVRVESGVKTHKDAYAWSGIWQEVSLIVADEAHITDIFVRTLNSGWTSVTVAIENSSDKSGDAELFVEVAENATPKKKIGGTNQTVHVTPGKNRAELSFRIKSPRLWSPDSPTLYVAQVSFRQKLDILDNLTLHYGYREAKDLTADATRLTLNGESRELLPENYALRRTAAPPDPLRVADGWEQQIAAAKPGTRRLLFIADGPLPSRLLDIADEKGVLLCLRPEDDSLSALESLLIQARTHPSVVAWVLPTGRLAALQSRGRELDPTRPLLALRPAGADH